MSKSRRLTVYDIATLFALGMLVFASAGVAFGQASIVRSGSFEIGPFIGASYGIDKFRVMGGANVTYALKNKYVLPYFEFSYFPGLPRTDVPVAPYVDPFGKSHAQFATYSLALSDFHGGVHVRLPVFRESRVVPYLVLGLGGLRHGTQNNVLETVPDIGSHSNTGTIPGGTDFAVNGGGGLRYYIGGTGTFGFRAEAKIYHATGGPFSGTNFGKVEAGFFFQLR